jgi:hypothetical protein
MKLADSIHPPLREQATKAARLSGYTSASAHD